MKPSRTKKIPCSVCGQPVRRTNLGKHFGRKHPMEEQAGIQQSLTSPPGTTSGHSKHDISTPVLQHEIHIAIDRAYRLQTMGAQLETLDSAIRGVTTNLCTVARHAAIFAMQRTLHHVRCDKNVEEHRKKKSQPETSTETPAVVQRDYSPSPSSKSDTETSGSSTSSETDQGEIEGPKPEQEEEPMEMQLTELAAPATFDEFARPRAISIPSTSGKPSSQPKQYEGKTATKTTDRNNNDPPISTPTKESSAAPHSTGHQSRSRKRKIE